MSSQARLIVILGLPGTGKTTLAMALSARTGARHLNTDRVRTRLGLRGQYDETTKAHVYDELLREARNTLCQGVPVVLDGTFYRQAFRDRIAGLAHETGADLKWIELRARPETVRQRVSGERPYSEADFSVYQKIREAYEPLEGERLTLDSDRQTLEAMLTRACEYIAL